jgi:hypothetical protein
MNFWGECSISKAVWPNHYCNYRGHILSGLQPFCHYLDEEQILLKKSNFREGRVLGVLLPNMLTNFTDFGRDYDRFSCYLMTLFQLLRTYRGEWGGKMIVNSWYVRIWNKMIIASCFHWLSRATRNPTRVDGNTAEIQNTDLPRWIYFKWLRQYALLWMEVICHLQLIRKCKRSVTILARQNGQKQILIFNMVKVVA